MRRGQPAGRHISIFTPRRHLARLVPLHTIATAYGQNRHHRLRAREQPWTTQWRAKGGKRGLAQEDIFRSITKVIGIQYAITGLLFTALRCTLRMSCGGSRIPGARRSASSAQWMGQEARDWHFMLPSLQQLGEMTASHGLPRRRAARGRRLRETSSCRCKIGRARHGVPEGINMASYWVYFGGA